MNGPGAGLDTLLDLDGSILGQEGDYWIRIEARRVPPSDPAQHGISYSPTLHDKYGTRVLGYDNAHIVDGEQGDLGSPTNQQLSAHGISSLGLILCV